MEETVSLELAKELNSAGWAASTRFIWQQKANGGWHITEPGLNHWECLPAPTLAEISLPDGYVVVQDGDRHRCFGGNPEKSETAIGAVEAAGLMWKRLRQEGLL